MKNSTVPFEMRLILFSYVMLPVLLVQLVLADLPAPAIKLLFDSDYVIGEGSDSSQLGYIYSGNRLGFEFRSEEDRNWMTIRIKLKAQNLSFVAESFASNQLPNNPRDAESIAFCLVNTSEKLKHLVESCEGNARLRLMNEEERQKMETFKEEQKKTKKPFEVTYENGRLNTRSFGVVEFNVARLKKSDGVTSLYLVSSVDRNASSPNGAPLDAKRNEISVKSQLTEKPSFIVEGLPSGSDVDCSLTDHPQLSPDRCEGAIQLKKVQ